MLHSWRNIFFFEGVLTIVVSIICYFVLPDSPGSAKFLTEEQRRLGTRRIYLEALSTGKEEVEKHHFVKSILNLNTWIMSVGLFCSLLCMNSVALFMVSKPQS
jgi:sugar phosphate permease